MRTTRPSPASPNPLLGLLLANSLAFSFYLPFIPISAGAPAPAGKKAAAKIRQGGALARYREGELLVRFREGVAEHERDEAAFAGGARRGKTLRGESRLEKLELRAGQNAELAAAELRLHPAVEMAEPNYVIARDELLPNDPRFPEQWALRNTGAGGGRPGADVGAAAAWEETVGAASTVIAVVDSGVDFTHPDLQSNRWTNPAERGNGRDDDRNGLTDDLYGWDWVENSGEVRDGQGHGTAVAGLIAARGDNRTGTAGVMWRAGLMSLRVLDSAGEGDVADAVEAIDYAAEHGAGVINCSWGTDAESKALAAAIRRAGERGALVVAPAGNDSRDIGVRPRYPAAYDLPNVISVASTDRFDQLTSWSNWGAPAVAVAAPGEGLLTTEPGGDYTEVTGTSASAALVSGTAGLIKTLRPGLKPELIREMIVRGVRPVASLAGKVASGSVVSASESVLAAALAPRDAGGEDADGGSVDPAGRKSEVAASTLNLPRSASTPSPARRVTPQFPVSNLPDLDQLRGVRSHEPSAPAAVPSRRRRYRGRGRASHPQAGAPQPATAPAAAPTGRALLAYAAREMFSGILSVALGGGRPVYTIPLMDYVIGGGYALSDSAPASPAAFAAATAVTFQPPGAVYLSDLNWTYVTQNYHGTRRDQNVTNGGPIKLDGQTYAKGLGTHAPSEIRYDLGGSYSAFLADVGVNDEISWSSTVVFQVWADGAKLYDSGVMTYASPKQAVSVDVTNRRELKLVVTEAGDGPSYDHVVWAGARIVRAAPADVYLSDLNWASATNNYHATRKDRNVTNDGPIKLDGTTYARGIGTHAPSDVRYDLGGSYSRFVADMGVNDEITWSASVTFEVWADGERLYQSGLLTHASPKQSINVSVAGKRELRLIVTEGGDGPSYDHVVWAGARLVPAPAVHRYLSDLTWVSATNNYTTTRKDRNVTNDGPIKLDAVTYAKGLGTHAPSEIVYDLGGNYSTFTSDVGLNDEVKWVAAASVVFQVWADGVKLYDSGVVRGSMPKKNINVSVAGRRELKLVVTEAGDGPSYDHVVWAGARLAQPAEEGLVARWKFDEIGGAMAADASGYGNTGTLQGPARDTGRVGAGSLRFDGTDDQVTVASTQGVTEVVNNFTLAFWAKPGATHQLDAEGTTGAPGVSGQKYAFSPNYYDAATGHAGAGVSVGTNGVSIYEHAGGYMPATLVHPATLSGWAHVVVVYANRRPSLYVNGVWQKDGQTSPKAYVHVTPMNVAGGYPGNYFKGSLDDVRIYNRALAGDEIAALAGAGGCFKDVEGFVSDFYQGALGRQPNGQGLREWVSRLTQAQGYDQLLAEGKALGRALFKSAEYGGRGRTSGQYVGDLYRAYLQREPDQAGSDAWTNAVNADPVNGRETALRGFEESAEFADRLAKLCGTSAATGFNFTTSGLAAPNRTGQPGVDLRSGNYNWGLPILGLPGRAGHDLSLSLSYNSRVWTRDGSAIAFDPDGGFPSAGFRLGFPTVQPRHYNAQTGKYAHTLVTPSGGRVELRQIDATNAYESADSSYLRLENYGPTLALWATDGTRMWYVLAGGEYRCTEIKDRNGNIISIAYDDLGQITKITDTLGREIVFNYDAFQNLQSIVQKRKRESAGVVVDDPHTVATFGYSDLTVQTNFSGMTVVGPRNGEATAVLAQVGLADGTVYRFGYTPWGQVRRVSRHTPAQDSYAAGYVPAFPQDYRERAYTSYNLREDGGAETDCPRFTERRDWAHDWNGDADGLPAPQEEAVTAYAFGSDATGSWGEVTLPAVAPATQGARFKEYYGTGWRADLVVRAEEYAAGDATGSPRKWTTTTWAQDDETLGYGQNPRATVIRVEDAEGNVRRTAVEYDAASPFKLPVNVREYGAGTAVLRRSNMSYVTATDYTSRRIIGLPQVRKVYEGESVLVSKADYLYDQPDEAGTPGVRYLQDRGATVQHDGAYGAGFRVGRGNLNVVRRWDVTDAATAVDDTKAVSHKTGYDTNGSVVLSVDPGRHRTSFGYADAFSVAALDGNRFAYPTRVTDADGFSSKAIYSYDLGAVTESQTPKPDQTAPDVFAPATAVEYDKVGRVVRVSNAFNAAYTRMAYPASLTSVQTYTLLTTTPQTVETYAARVFDGAGRARAASRKMAEAGRYSGQKFVYDVLGRLVNQSNPTAMTAAWEPVDEDTGDAVPAAWYYSAQAYDWQGRPTYSTNADGSPGQEITYGGCGCAGGAVVTVTDAVGRRQKSYSDALGRLVKAEVLNLDGSVYSTAVTTYNALDQVTRVRAHQGGEAGPYQEATNEYDGHGRLWKSKAPVQARPTTYQYNSDDTMWKVFTPREPSGGAAQDVITTFTYNGRRQVTRVGYDVPAGLTNTVRAAATVEAGYDAAGNRLWMTDGMGRADYQYDALSRLQSETRQFTGLAGTFPLSYAYDLAGAIKSIRDKWDVEVNYNYDAAGSLSSVTGSGYGGVQTYAQNAQYRASGAVKSLAYGNGAQLSLEYTSRMEVSNYKLTVPGAQTTTAMDVDYGYGADGLLRDSTDRADATLRRAYGYDHAGRLTNAYTGSEANTWVQTNGASTGTVVDGPYRQSYAYDAWDNRTSKFVRAFTGTHARQQTVNYTLNGATGRNTAWDYDAGGLVRAADGVSNFYDAAGRLREVSSDAGGAQFEYDGDGQVVKKLGGGGAVYYLRSSVLGQTVAEVASDGSRGTGFVYAGGELVATQVGGGQVTWQHVDASGASRRTTDASGAVVGRDEVDPEGVTVQRPNTSVPLYRAGGGGGERRVGGGEMSLNPASLMDARFCDFGTLLVPCAMVSSFGAHLDDVRGSRAGPDSLTAFWETGLWSGANYGALFLFAFDNAPEALVEALGAYGGRGFSPSLSFAQGSGRRARPDRRRWVVRQRSRLPDPQPAPPQTPPNSTQRQAQPSAPSEPAPATQPSANGFPCPPTGNELLQINKRTNQLIDTYVEAWNQAMFENREIGGWIYMDKGGRLQAVIKGYRGPVDGQAGVVLTSPPAIRGKIIVGTFHVHINDFGPSETVLGFVTGDKDMNTKVHRVPGILLRRSVFEAYGPERGFWRQDLPKRCR